MQVVHAPDGDNVKTFDGRRAWVAEGWRPLPLMELTAATLEGARIEALTLSRRRSRMRSPGGRVGTRRSTTSPSRCLQGRAAAAVRELLLRRKLVCSCGRSGGIAPLSERCRRRMDFSDYRDGSQGIKLPFKIVITWTDGQNTIALNQIQNERVD
jgi:hypothetical protein